MLIPRLFTVSPSSPLITSPQSFPSHDPYTPPGTRFRPLSLDVPKPLFPVAGLPMVQHHIEACAAVPDIREVLLLGYFPAQQLQQFVADMIAQYKIRIR
ncbi:Mannose-1-phosphate guanyltransferase alpha-B [Portunus trituberculatus]|uniref:Mannose-1-phosphate guanyltransferase alpha-B n=1 Tax=Portunus trituberculatus TaxID=210409 RepID=A0A5B7IP94_PORTR|nr:Mannose-1-phosphate guanyltransferase alpha-B [Portunus trituberculatus]